MMNKPNTPITDALQGQLQKMLMEGTSEDGAVEHCVNVAIELEELVGALKAELKEARELLGDAQEELHDYAPILCNEIKTFFQKY